MKKGGKGPNYTKPHLKPQPLETTNLLFEVSSRGGHREKGRVSWCPNNTRKKGEKGGFQYQGENSHTKDTPLLSDHPGFAHRRPQRVEATGSLRTRERGAGVNEQEVFTPPALKIVWQFSAMVPRGGTHDSSLSTRDCKKKERKRDRPAAQRQMDGSGIKKKK